MVSDYNTPYLSGVRGVVSHLLLPLQYVASRPSAIFDETRHYFSAVSQLIAKNQTLEHQLLLLNIQLQHQSALSQENKQLRTLINSLPEMNHPVLIAHLLSVNTGPFVSQMILNKGKKDRVYVGQPVFDDNGIMGQVIEISLHTSRVLLLDDLKSAIPVEIKRNGIRAIIVGQGVGHSLKLIQVPKTADIVVGDLLVSSGLGQRFPAGYPVATVKQVIHSPGEAFAHILADPVACLDRNNQVLLMWPNVQSTLALDKPEQLYRRTRQLL